MPNKLGKTEICNIALRRLGVRPVNNVETDVDNAAQEMRAVWDLSVDTALRSADWNFARKIIPLAELAEEEILGWRFVYMYPKDCATLWAVEDRFSIRCNDIHRRWQVVRTPDTNLQAIVADIENAYARYTALVTEPTQWDALFVDALGWRLAMDACQSLASDTGQFQKCSQAYNLAMSQAQTANKTEHGNHENEHFGFFINCR